MLASMVVGSFFSFFLGLVSGRRPARTGCGRAAATTSSAACISGPTAASAATAGRHYSSLWLAGSGALAALSTGVESRYALIGAAREKKMGKLIVAAVAGGWA